MTNPALSQITSDVVSAFLDAGMADAATFAINAIATPVACTVLVDRDMQLAGYESRVANRTVAITCMTAQTGVPVRGSVFVVGAERWVVDSIVEQKEDIAVCLVIAEVAP